MHLLLPILFSLPFFSDSSEKDQKVSVNKELIHTVSSFEQVDYFTSYDLNGNFLWEIPFKTKIESLKVLDENQILIFSRHRNNLAYFLSLVDEQSG